MIHSNKRKLIILYNNLSNYILTAWVTSGQSTLSMISFSTTIARDSILVPTCHVFSTRVTCHVTITILAGRYHFNINSRITDFPLNPRVNLLLGPLKNVSKCLNHASRYQSGDLQNKFSYFYKFFHCADTLINYSCNWPKPPFQP